MDFALALIASSSTAVAKVAESVTSFKRLVVMLTLLALIKFLNTRESALSLVSALDTSDCSPLDTTSILALKEAVSAFLRYGNKMVGISVKETRLEISTA